MRVYLLALTRNPVSLLGAALTTASAILILTLFGIGLVGYAGGPYVGILTYVFLPIVFLFGLLLIPIGAWWERRRHRRATERGEPAPRFPVLDFNRDRVRRAALLVLVATAVNVAILAIASYKAVEVVESTEFCGSACHSVMEPESTAHRRSAHSTVPCVSCHIGPGAGSFVKSKLSGAWQLVSVALDLHPRPIPAPVHDLRPARETCGACHAAAEPVEDRLRVVSRYAEDEANTETKTVLLVKIGGLAAGGARGIHWHADPALSIRFRSDPKRENIQAVRVERGDGKVDTYLAEGASATPDDDGEAWRTMDCTDCHNRPSHVFRMPEDEVDDALARGRLDRSLPYLKREAMKVMKETYVSHGEAKRGIAERIRRFYAENHPSLFATRSNAVWTAGELLAEIYASNVFPGMNVTWGTYPSHLGHRNSPGCFRCHDGAHSTSDGRTIGQDCSACHEVLAMEEENPAILGQLQPGS